MFLINFFIYVYIKLIILNLWLLEKLVPERFCNQQAFANEYYLDSDFDSGIESDFNE